MSAAPVAVLPRVEWPLPLLPQVPCPSQAPEPVQGSKSRERLIVEAAG